MYTLFTMAFRFGSYLAPIEKVSHLNERLGKVSELEEGSLALKSDPLVEHGGKTDIPGPLQIWLNKLTNRN